VIGFARLALVAAVLAGVVVALPSLAQAVAPPKAPPVVAGPRAAAAPAVPAGAPAPGAAAVVARGRDLFVSGCSYCHGLDATGVRGRAPTVRGAGAESADFYLSTGRMPLAHPHAYPVRSKPAYPPADIRALVAYVGSLGGPPVPGVSPATAGLATGERAFADHCAGCHQVSARGGIVTGAVAPSLQRATATQIAEAIRVGPYVMPNFSEREIDGPTLNSIVRYVLSTRHPVDRGGWGIGHIGPIPEGMIAWIFAMGALLGVSRVIGERSEGVRPPPSGPEPSEPGSAASAITGGEVR